MKAFYFFKCFAVFTVTKNYLSVKETSKYLGVCELAVQELIKKRAIPYYEPFEKMYLLKKVEVDQWVTRSRASTKSEIEQEKRRKSYNVFT